MNQFRKSLLVCLSLPFVCSITAMENYNIRADVDRTYGNFYEILDNDRNERDAARRLAEESLTIQPTVEEEDFPNRNQQNHRPVLMGFGYGAATIVGIFVVGIRVAPEIIIDLINALGGH